MERRTKEHQQRRRQREEAAKFVVRGEEEDDDDDAGQGLVPINDSYNKRSSITEKKSVYTTVPMIAAALLCVVGTV
jgi:hypothetical protein